LDIRADERAEGAVNARVTSLFGLRVWGEGEVESLNASFAFTLRYTFTAIHLSDQNFPLSELECCIRMKFVVQQREDTVEPAKSHISNLRSFDSCSIESMNPVQS
jgi:hypothetical protein